MASSLTSRSLALVLSVAAGPFASSALAAPVTPEDLLNAQDNAGEWLMYGRDYRNWRLQPARRDHARQRRPS